jgi:transcription antitermination factor NusG
MLVWLPVWQKRAIIAPQRPEEISFHHTLKAENLPHTAPTVTNHLHEQEPRWFAVRTRSKSEKFVQRVLAKKGIHAYLPLQRLLRRYTRSTRMVERPLINCYVFVRIVKEQYVPVLETENVAGFVRFSKNLLAIPESEIEILRRITLEDGLDVEATPGNFAEGDPVEISAGNLMGLKGRIVQAEGRRRFRVELLTLGYDLLITIDAAFLAKVGRI